MRIIVGIVVAAFLIHLFVNAVGNFDEIGPDGVMLVGLIMVAGIGAVLGVFKP